VATERRELVSLAPDQVHIWYRLTESLGEPALAVARALLSAEERSRHDGIRLARDRRDYAAAHALLRTSLSCYTEVEPQAWAFEAGAHRKPELSVRAGLGVRLTFNLSHARGMVACAIAPGTPVGIDVEPTDVAFDYSSIVSRYLAPDEIVQLDRCPPQDRSARFVELWTLKEAYIKATGRGLSEALSGFGFQIEGDQIQFMPPANVNAGAWQFALFALEPHYRMAVAIACKDTRVWKITARSSARAPKRWPPHSRLKTSMRRRDNTRASQGIDRSTEPAKLASRSGLKGKYPVRP
jgi:4'-phosphopantetheinyl transferase